MLAGMLAAPFSMAYGQADFNTRIGSQPVIRGQLAPRQTASLSSSLSGTLVDIPFRAGDAFKKGDRLYRINCTVYENELAEARANSVLARKTLDAYRQLEGMQSISELEIAQAENALAVAEAQTEIHKAVVDKCQFVAPFDGRVLERAARPLEYVNIGDELLSIVDNDSLEIEILIPSTLIPRFGIGTRIRFNIEEIQVAVSARIISIGSYIDPASRTIRIRASLDNGHPPLLSGMTGTIALTAIDGGDARD